MTTFLEIFIMLTITGSIFSIFVIGSKNLLLKQYGAKRYKWLCIINLTLYAFPFSLINIFNNKRIIQIDVKSLPFPSSNDAVLIPQNMVNTSFDVKTIMLYAILIIWLIIAVTLILRKISQYQLYCKNIISHSVIASLQMKSETLKISQSIGIKKQYTLLVNKDILSPMVIGFNNLYIVLPPCELTEEELSLVILHEMTHIKNLDHITKLGFVIFSCVYWFNPFAWILTKYFSEACELACDEQLISTMREKQKQYYAEMILNLLASKSHQPLLSNAFAKKITLKRRIELIMNKRQPSQKNIVLITVIISLLSLTIIGCTQMKEEAPFDYTTEMSNTGTQITGTFLKDSKTAFDVSADKQIYLSNTIKTNSKKIGVSISDIKNNKTILVYLYDSLNDDEPIQYITITKETQKAKFENLTSAKSYIVGALIEEGDEPVSIELTE